MGCASSGMGVLSSGPGDCAGPGEGEGSGTFPLAIAAITSAPSPLNVTMTLEFSPVAGVMPVYSSTTSMANVRFSTEY